MRMPYLEYLAEIGATYIHPLAQRATDCLIAALDPRPGERLLEVGCGTAETMARLILQEEVSVDGVDVLLPMLRVARRRLSLIGARARAFLALADGVALPAATCIYDSAYTESVLGFQDAATAGTMLREIQRVLKPGRRYVANEAIWKAGTDLATAAAIHRAGVADFGLGQASPQPWSVDDWVQLMEESGFIVEAADLLAERIAPPDGGYFRQRWRLKLSAMLTAAYRIRSFFMPRLLRKKWLYRQRLADHREDGLHLESRLFVLQSE